MAVWGVRVRRLVEDLMELAGGLGLEGRREFRTRDRTRIDFAFTLGARRLLAVEFEGSRKWLFARVLYNAVKAHRAEFPAILFVYPYRDLPKAGRSWVPDYVEGTLGLRLGLCHPKRCVEAARVMLSVLSDQLGMEIDRHDEEEGEGWTVVVGAESWTRLWEASPNPSVGRGRVKSKRKRRTTAKTKRGVRRGGGGSYPFVTGC